MNASVAASTRALGRNGQRASRLSAQISDFTDVLTGALEDALAALAHRSPENYLLISAAQRREAAQAEGRVSGDGRGGKCGPRSRQTHSVMQELRLHLAFEFLNAARRYAVFVANFGDYEQGNAWSSRPPLTSHLAASMTRIMPGEYSHHPRC